LVIQSPIYDFTCLALFVICCNSDANRAALQRVRGRDKAMPDQPTLVFSDRIGALLQGRIKRILDVVELAVAAEKFPHLRSLILNELGQSGFQGDLARLCAGEKMARNGAGRTDSGKKGGSP
jgi:hypothetical protein